ncbi:hypothetical protein D3C73_1508080 [compost metagenome]
MGHAGHFGHQQFCAGKLGDEVFGKVQFYLGGWRTFCAFRWGRGEQFGMGLSEAVHKQAAEQRDDGSGGFDEAHARSFTA